MTLLHVDAEVDAETLTSLCQPLVAPQPPVGIVRQPREPVPEETLPAEAAQIRQALVQSGGNVSRAARLLGVSRNTIRYRMQRYGIARSHLGVPAPAASPRASGAGAGRPSSRRDAPPPEAQLHLTAPLAQHEATPPPGSLQHGAMHDAAIESHAHTPEPSWEQKPVAVLALEVSWPDDSGVEFPRYDLWTERARWKKPLGIRCTRSAACW
jgi:transposase-like protein